MGQSGGRYYEVTLDGDLLPVRVVVPCQEDEDRERHEAIMFAREAVDRRHHILKGCQRGGVVHILDRGRNDD